MSKKKFLDLEDFLYYYRKFYSISTWTKEKHDSHKELIDFLNGLEKVEISSSRDSSTTKIKIMNGFTIFKVLENQRGKMKPYRDMWVLMYCKSRYYHSYQLKVFPLEKGIQENQSLSLENEFDYKYLNYFNE